MTRTAGSSDDVVRLRQAKGMPVMFKSTSTSLVLLGILAVIVGVFAIAWPGVTILALVILFAVYAFLDGGLQATRAFTSRRAGPVFGHLLLVWHQLAASIDQLRLLLIATCRPTPRRPEVQQARAALARRGGAVVSLGPLAETDAAALVTSMLGAPPSGRLRQVTVRAAGNPLYLRELIDALVRERALHVSPVAEVPPIEEQLPASLAAVLNDRLSAVSAETAQILRTAALLGGKFTVTGLAVLLHRPTSELAAGLQEAVAAGILVGSGDELVFRHQLILSGNPAAAVSGLATGLCAAVAAGLLVAILHSPRGRARLRRPVTAAVRLTQRLVRRPAGDPGMIAAGSLKPLGTFDLGLPPNRWAQPLPSAWTPQEPPDALSPHRAARASAARSGRGSAASAPIKLVGGAHSRLTPRCGRAGRSRRGFRRRSSPARARTAGCDGRRTAIPGGWGAAPGRKPGPRSGHSGPRR
jgi:Short repeat of unknown function (DUF308)